MIGYAIFRLQCPVCGARCGDKRKDDRDFLPSFMWCHQESNRGHKDFQSFALPTELWHLALDCECKVIAFCRIHQIFSQLFFKKINNCDKMVVRDGRGGYEGRTFGTHSLIYPQSRHPAYRHAPAWRSPTSLARWLHGYAPPPGCDFVGGFRSPHVATPPRGEIRGYARLPSPAGD